MISYISISIRRIILKFLFQFRFQFIILAILLFVLKSVCQLSKSSDYLYDLTGVVPFQTFLEYNHTWVLESEDSGLFWAPS